MRRLEGAIDKDPNLTLERRDDCKSLLRNLIDMLGVMIEESENGDIVAVTKRIDNHRDKKLMNAKAPRMRHA
jgi:hypothetical protein